MKGGIALKAFHIPWAQSGDVALGNAAQCPSTHAGTVLVFPQQNHHCNTNSSHQISNKSCVANLSKHTQSFMYVDKYKLPLP